MFRFRLAAALTAATAILTGASALALPGGKDLVGRSIARWAPRLNTQTMRTAGVSSQAISSRARLAVFILPTSTSSLIDNDGDGQPGTGDMVIASGVTEDLSGQNVGVWEGTFSHTSDDTSMVHLTLRFPGRGCVTISGAPYADGSPIFDSQRKRFPAAPIVGYTGSARYRGSAGFGADQDNNLTVLLPR